MITALLRETLASPRIALRRILSMELPAWVGTVGLLLTSICSAVLLHLIVLNLGGEEREMVALTLGGPFVTAVVQFVLLLLAAQLLYRVGRWRGGHGTLAQSVLAIAWLQVVMFLLQLVQIALLLILPPLGIAAGYVSLVIFFWLVSNFTAEVHGFQSLPAVLAGIVITLFAALLVLSLVISLVLSLLYGPDALEVLRNV